MDYKIANTTKKQRAEYVKKAFGILVAGDMSVPSDNAFKYLKEYIDGITELKDVQQKILNMYKSEE